VDSGELKVYVKYIQSRSLFSCNSIKSFDFFTLYTTIPNRLRELVQHNGQRRYKYIVLWWDKSNFVMKKTTWIQNVHISYVGFNCEFQTIKNERYPYLKNLSSWYVDWMTETLLLFFIDQSKIYFFSKCQKRRNNYTTMQYNIKRKLFYLYSI
jgi:hypothetical protein